MLNRRWTTSLAQALAIGFAGCLALSGCGSEPGSSKKASATEPASSTSASKPAVQPGAVPEQSKEAVEKALGLAGKAVGSQQTVHSKLTQKSSFGSSVTEADIDVKGASFLAKTRQLDGRGETGELYSEKSKVYYRASGSSTWKSIASPISIDPLKSISATAVGATVDSVGGVLTVEGRKCREATLSVDFGKALEAVGGDSLSNLKGLLGDLAGSKVNSDICLDDSGLIYRSASSIDFSKLLDKDSPLAAAASKLGTFSIVSEFSDYGTAPKPKRPEGINEATEASPESLLN